MKSDFGLSSLWELPNDTMRSLSIATWARGITSVVAGIICGACGLQAGHALTQFAGSLGDKIQSHGSDAADKVFNPAQQAQVLQEQAHSAAVNQTAHGSGFKAMADTEIFNLSREVGTAKGVIKAAGVSSPHDAGMLSGAISGGVTGGNIKATAQAANTDLHDDPKVASKNLASVAGRISQSETSARMGSVRGTESAARMTGQNVLDFSQSQQFWNQTQDFHRGQTSQKMVDDLMKFAHGNGSPISEDQAWSHLSRYRDADTRAGMDSTYGNVDRYEKYKEFGIGMDMAHKEGFVKSARELGYSPFDIKRAEGRYESAKNAGTLEAFNNLSAHDFLAAGLVQGYSEAGHGDALMKFGMGYGRKGSQGVKDLAFDMERHKDTNNYGSMLRFFGAARELGMSPVKLAASESGGNVSFAANPEQLKKMRDMGVITSAQYAVGNKNGAKINASFAPTDDGVKLTTSSLQSGKRAIMDDQVTIRDGARADDALDGALVMVQPKKIAAMMETLDWEYSVSNTSANAMRTFVDNQQQHSLDRGQSAQVPLVVYSARVDDSINTSSSANVMLGANLALVDGLKQEADHQIATGQIKPEERNDFIADHLSNAHVHFQKRYGEIAKDEAGYFHLQNEMKEYLQKEELTVADKTIDIDMAHKMTGVKPHDKQQNKKFGSEFDSNKNYNPKVGVKDYVRPDGGYTKRGTPPQIKDK